MAEGTKESWLVAPERATCVPRPVAIMSFGHTSAIYRKLAVGSRDDAIARATELGLL